MPERFSWTLAAITLSCSWTAWLRTWTRALKRVASMTSSGYGAIAHSVSGGENQDEDHVAADRGLGRAPGRQGLDRALDHPRDQEGERVGDDQEGEAPRVTGAIRRQVPPEQAVRHAIRPARRGV